MKNEAAWSSHHSARRVHCSFLTVTHSTESLCCDSAGDSAPGGSALPRSGSPAAPARGPGPPATLARGWTPSAAPLPWDVCPALCRPTPAGLRKPGGLPSAVVLVWNSLYFFVFFFFYQQYVFIEIKMFIYIKDFLLYQFTLIL